MNYPTLPGNRHFYNRLNRNFIDDKEYKHAWKVWNTFTCENMRDYTQLYKTSDVLILADVMENFQDESLKSGSRLVFYTFRNVLECHDKNDWYLTGIAD